LARSAVGYLVKYATKGDWDNGESAIPKGARLFGCGAASAERHDIRRARLPAWLEACTESVQLPKRVVRVGWVCPDTDQVYRSPFQFHLHREDDGRYVIVFINQGDCNAN